MRVDKVSCSAICRLVSPCATSVETYDSRLLSWVSAALRTWHAGADPDSHATRIGSADATVRVWDLATGTPIGDPVHRPHRALAAVATAQLDGRPVVISGSDDSTVRVWDLATGATDRRPVHRPHRPRERGGDRAAGRAPRGGLRQRRRHGAGVGPGHRPPVGAPFTGHTAGGTR